MHKHEHGITKNPASLRRAQRPRDDDRGADESTEQKDAAVRGFVFFWLSVSAFITTVATVIPFYCWAMSSQHAGDWKFISTFMSLLGANFGMAVSAVLGALAIPTNKAAIPLFVVEFVVVVYLLTALHAFGAGVLLFPVW